jgi:hypothetical protein
MMLDDDMIKFLVTLNTRGVTISTSCSPQHHCWVRRVLTCELHALLIDDHCGGSFSNVLERFGYAARPSDMKYAPWELDAAMRMVAIESTRWVCYEVRRWEICA